MIWLLLVWCDCVACCYCLLLAFCLGGLVAVWWCFVFVYWWFGLGGSVVGLHLGVCWLLFDVPVVLPLGCCLWLLVICLLVLGVAVRFDCFVVSFGGRLFGICGSRWRFLAGSSAVYAALPGF